MKKNNKKWISKNYYKKLKTYKKRVANYYKKKNVSAKTCQKLKWKKTNKQFKWLQFCFCLVQKEPNIWWN